MPHQLVTLLREVSAELASLGSHAADQASEARTAALSITLEAVKAGIPPGALRDLAVKMREDATRSAERLAHDRARVSLRIGQALARATTLAREADMLQPTRQRASWLALMLHQAARELSLGGSSVGGGALIGVVHATSHAVERPTASVVDGFPGVEVPRPDGGGWRARLAWDTLQGPWLRGDGVELALCLAGQVVPERPVSSALAPRVWLQVDGRDLAASHREEAPVVELADSLQAGVVDVGRRKVAVARPPATLHGLQGWRVLGAAGPQARPVRPQTRRAGEVILFPGMR